MNEELKIIISAEINKLKQGMADAKKEASSFKQQYQKAAKDVDDKFKSLGSSIGSAMKKGAEVVAASAVAIAGSLVACVAGTEEYRENQAKLATAFEMAGSSAETAKSTYNDLYRVLGDSGQATEAAAHLSKLTTSEQGLAEWTNICQGVYATFGDSLPIEGLTEASNETAKVGQVTGVLADALNWAGVSEDEFNDSLAACNDEAEREQLIRETLNGLYSDAAGQYEENNAQILAQRDAQAQLQETLAQVGEAVSPLTTAFTEFANDALAQVLPYIQQFSEQYGPVLSDALSTVADTLGTIFGFITENIGVLATIAGIITGIAAAIGIYNAVAAIKAAMAVAEVTTVWGLVAAYAAQAAAMIVAIAPYVLIVAAIAAVIAVIVVCIKHWDNIKAKVTEVWTSIKEKTVEAVEAVKEKFNNMKEAISEKVSAIKQAVVDKFNAIKDGMKEKVQAAKDAVVNKFTEIKSSITEKVEGAKTAVHEKFDAIKSGIASRVDAVKSKVKSTFDAVKEAITHPVETAKTAVHNAIEKIKGFFKFEWSLPHLKMPHPKISGKFSLNPPSVPHFSISWYKNGGVFDSPHLFGYGNGMLGGLGEAGAEAIVPLEKNTKWLDRMATMLAEKQGGGRPIYLQVDGKTFAQISVDSINELTKQTGNLPLVLA